MQLLIYILIYFFVLINVSYAKPVIKIIKTTDFIERGTCVQVIITIFTNETLQDIEISPVEVQGFEIKPIRQPFIEIRNQKKDDYVFIKYLYPGNYSVAFKIKAPPLFSHKSITTREDKIFTFNIRYKIDNRYEAQTVSVTFKYITSLYFYLFWGLVGIIFGHFIKITTREADEIRKELEKVHFGIDKLKTILWYVFIKRLLSCLMLLIIGICVLLMLAKTKIPVRGWYDSVALGIALGIFGDDQLLQRLRGGTKG